MITEITNLLENMTDEELQKIKHIFEVLHQSKTNSETLKVFKMKNSHKNTEYPITKDTEGYNIVININEELILQPYQTYIAQTGLKFQIPEGYFLAIHNKTNFLLETKIMCANTFIGQQSVNDLVDINILLFNSSDEPQLIAPSSYIIKLILVPYINIPLEIIEEEPETL